MKIAVIKLGGRIANEGHGITAFEAVSVSKMLSIGGNQVDCFTKISDKDIPIPELNIYEISDHYESVSKNYDALVILNGNINFYGGVETPEQLLNLHIINNFSGGPLFYIFIDTLLPLKNVWDSVKIKPWGHKYKESNINITRDDIIYVTMCYDTNAVLEITNKTGINPKEIIYFPFEKYAFFSDRLTFTPTKTVDLIYGGNSFRNKREKKWIKYYFDLPSDISTLFYGKIKLDDFNPKLIIGKTLPTFEGPILFKENLRKLGSGLATLNISDKFNEGRQLNPRIYEAVLANTVSFMDLEYDPQRKAFSNSFLQEFLYVSSQEELIDKIRSLKKVKGLFESVISLQYENSFISKEELSRDFSNLVKILHHEWVKNNAPIVKPDFEIDKPLKAKALF